MKLTNRYTGLVFLFTLVVPIALTGCIVVVEEDDRHDRHRHLHGIEWELEILFYRTQTLQAADRGVVVDFEADGLFTAVTDCGNVTGRYQVNENGGLTVDEVSVHENCRGEGATELFAQGLREAQTYEADESTLQIATRENGYLSFSSK